jgi:endonuclease/exonuclease/phosphatase family metal-dependent hydrolase
MKKSKLNAMRPLVIALFCSLATWSGLAQTPLSAMSYNIRFDTRSDGENWWEYRKDKVSGLINYYGADFIGAQEVLHHQLSYLLTRLKSYTYIGVGRDDGRDGGEFSPIFYNKEKYKLLRQGTFWLSPTPDSVSRGWDAACNRVCTYGEFQHRRTHQKLWVFNIHLDHIGQVARIESVRLITQRILALTERSTPVILTGDFNATPSDEPIQFLSSTFVNARTVSIMPAYGPPDTWNGFRFDLSPDGCIDYIFLKKNDRVQVLKFATITDSSDRRYPSDHFPVLAVMEIR